MAVAVSSLHDALKEHFGFDRFKGNQEKIIESVLAGKDTFVIMPTGGGKSLCYQMPALMSKGTAIIISPLIALMKNQVDQIRSYSSKDHVAHFLNSSLSRAQQKKVKADLTTGATKMLYVAPETLTKEENIQFFSDMNVSFVAVDEAHCISEWGHDFRPEYRKIRQMIDLIGEKIPIVALTATATPKVQSDIVKNLGLKKPNIFISSFNRPNLYYEVRPKGRKEAALKGILKFVKQHQGKSGIIYVLSRKSTEELAEFLNVNGVKAAAYHAGLEAAVRSSRQDQFLMEDVDVIVATIAFGMGIDKPDVRFVIHYNMPKSLENYYQETGRGGRDGLEGNCIAFFSYADMTKLEKFMRDKNNSEREMGGHLIDETIAYAESSVCRRKFLLNYFGEKYESKNCGYCDNCLHPKEQTEAEDEVMLMLETIEAVHESFPIDYVIHVITGKGNQQISMFKHDEIELFGEGKEKDEPYWRAVYRSALIDDLLIKDIENYGVIKLSEKGKKFLKKPHSMMVSINHDYDATPDEDAGGGGGTAALDNTLLKLLHELRKDVAKKYKMPPFVIFQDPSLEDMATEYPTTIDELAQISGVSRGKIDRFGQPFIELIKNYVEENEIERPTEMLVKSVVNKSVMKVYIIQQIDKKLSFENIASAKGMTFYDLLNELESIVSSGTRINIDYYLNDMMEPEAQQEIFDYFRTAKSDSIQDAMEELGKDTFTEEEVRLVRLKFMSVMAN